MDAPPREQPSGCSLFLLAEEMHTILCRTFRGEFSRAGLVRRRGCQVNLGDAPHLYGRQRHNACAARGGGGDPSVLDGGVRQRQLHPPAGTAGAGRGGTGARVGGRADWLPRGGGGVHVGRHGERQPGALWGPCAGRPSDYEQHGALGGDAGSRGAGRARRGGQLPARHGARIGRAECAAGRAASQHAAGERDAGQQ